MTCSETREYVFAFLDNELDAPLSIELQRHLDRCHYCAREVEIERAIRRQLGLALEGNGVGVELDEPSLRRMVEKITECGTDPAMPGLPTAIPGLPGPVGQTTDWKACPTAWWSRRAALAAGIAAGFVVAVSAWVAFDRLESRSHTPDAEHGRQRFADLVVADFEHFLEGGGTVQLASADPVGVSDWLREQTDLEVTLPVPGDPHCRLLGGRKCKIAGRLAAFAIYEMNGVPSSLVAVAGGHGELDGMRRVQHEGRTHWVDHCKGLTVVACRQGELVYAAVSTLPEKELLFLMTGIGHEGD